MTRNQIASFLCGIALCLPLDFSALHAQESVPPADAAPTAGGQEAAPGVVQFLPLMIIGVMFYFIMLRPQQKEQQRRKETLNALKKHDRVVTNGGMIGSVADLSGDGRFVTLKVDDQTRIKFLRSSIHGLLEEKSES